jgi:hypothetical protein
MRHLSGRTACSGPSDRLDVDFLPLLAHRAAAARVVRPAPQGPSVEPVLELLPVLGFPRLDWQAVLLLDLVPVPLGEDVERAEGYDAEVWSQVVDVAALEALLVLVMLQMAGHQRRLLRPTIVMPTSLPFLLLITTPS